VLPLDAIAVLDVDVVSAVELIVLPPPSTRSALATQLAAYRGFIVTPWMNEMQTDTREACGAAHG